MNASTTRAASACRRLNVTLPLGTVQLLDRVAKKGDRSAFVNQAVHYYIKEVGTANLRQQLQQGALARADRDATLAGEWFSLDEEVCLKRRHR